MKNIYKNVSMQLKRLIARKGTFDESLNPFLNPSNHSSQKRAFIVMLVANSIGISPSLLKKDTIGSHISSLQHKVSEITEMMHTSHILHQRVLDFSDISEDDRKTENIKEAHKQNILSILIGDKLLATASRGLAELHNPLIVEWMSSALQDLSEFGFFISEKFDETRSESILSNLEKRCLLSGGSLLAYSCKSVALLAGYSIENDSCILNDTYNIGKHIGITFQLQDMLDSSAIYKFEPEKLKKEETLNFIRKLLDKHITACLHLVDYLQESESSKTLRLFVLAIANKYLHQNSLEQQLI